MYPSNPAQPPKPPVNPQGREIPGVTKRPIAPMRGQATPAVDYRQAAAKVMAQQAQSAAPSGASTMQAPARSAMLQAPQSQPAPARPSMQAAPQHAPQQSMMAKAAANLAGRQNAGPAMDLSADAARKRQAAALALQRQQQGPVSPQAQAGLDAMFQSAMGGLTDRETPVAGHQWDPSVGGVGAWVPQTGDSMLPPGVRGGDPGTYLKDGTWVYDPTQAAANAIATDTARTAAGTYEDFLMPEDQRTAQEDAIKRAAAQAMRQQAQMMAARGMGGSGVEMMGLGDINANVMDAMNDMNAADRAQAIEQFLTQRGQDFGAFGQSRAAGMSEKQQAIENARYDEEAAYAKEQEKDANAVAMISNALGLTGADQLSGGLLAEGLAAYEEGDDAFRQWVQRTQTQVGSDGISSLTRENKTYQPPPGWSGDWNALTAAEQSLILTGYNMGLDTETPPPGSGLTQEAWDSLDPAQKEQILRGKSGPTQP